MMKFVCASPERLKHIGTSFIVAGICLLVFSLLPLDIAYGKTRINTRTDTRVNTRTENQSTTQPVTINVPTTRLEYTFTDPDTGTTLDYYPPIVESETEPATPYVESIDVASGEECLHPEGECDACDKLRDMYRNGEVDELHRISTTPAIDWGGVNGRLEVSVSLESDAETCVIDRCDGEDLKSIPSTISSSNNDGSNRLSLSGNAQEIQSPFGVSFNRGIAVKSPTAHEGIKVRAQTPPDDDDKEEEKEEEKPFPLLEIVVFIAVVVFLRFIWVARSTMRS